MSVLKWLWRLFSSVRLAFFLIMAIAALSLVGTIVIQVPAETASDHAGYQAWLETIAVQKFGMWTPLLASLQLFDVFHSPWFASAGILLITNIIVCSIARWPAIHKALAGQQPQQPDEFYAGAAGTKIHSGISSNKAVAVASSLLKTKGYRLRSENKGEQTYIAADKNRYSRLATYISHLSLILFIAGYLFGSYFGFRESSFNVVEGTIREVGFDTGLSLKLESFVDEYWPEGVPKDYRSDVVLYQNGQEVKRDTIRVNQPLSYKGIRFYQSNFGEAARLKVSGSNNQTFFDGGVPLTDLIQNSSAVRRTASFELPGYTAVLASTALNIEDPFIKPGQIGLELYRKGTNTPAAYGILQSGSNHSFEGMEFTYINTVDFSGFQVSRDPGNGLIWTASILFMVGITLALFLPHRQLRLMVRPSSDAGSEVFIRSDGRKTAGDFDTIEKEIKSKLSGAGK